MSMQLRKVYPIGQVPSQQRLPPLLGPVKPRKKKRAAQPDRMYVTPQMAPITPGASSSYPMRNRRSTPLTKSILSSVTPAGVEFLKCAFAPPDFNNTQVHGLPDDYEGNSLVKKHKLIAPISLAASTDYYYLLMPVPGVAYYSLAKATGVAPVAADVWVPTLYSDFASLFGTTATSPADIVDKFRFISNHIELIPTTNSMQWTGNVQSWKLPVQITLANNTTAGAYSINGLNGVNATNALQYTAPFNAGVYACAYNAGAKFDFTPILENFGQAGFITGSGVLGLSTNLVIPGFDNNFESVVIKITGIGTNISDTLIVKTWACVEYQVLPGNALYEYMTVSPVDPLAMKLYRKIIQQLPTAVAYFDNDSFWQRVLSIIQSMSGAASFIPGPVGRIAKGVGLASSAFRQLTM